MFYGLIGYPLTYSFSPAYFKNKFAVQRIDADYQAFALSSITELPALLKAHPNLRGLNVTIPYKEAVIPYLDRLDEMAADIGAVNCISIHDGITKGYNTDAAGFEESLVPLLKSHHTHALVLGTGGASKAVIYALNNLGISHHCVSREKKPGCISYDDVTGNTLNTHKLIINTSPVGVYPDVDKEPALPYEVIGRDHLLYDLIYNPEETKFLSLGKKHGATTKNGFEMLQLQAEASWKIWTAHTL
jgi:shikimate dehydrogenase